jgi:hypothetical protein
MSSYQSLSCQSSCERALKRDRPPKEDDLVGFERQPADQGKTTGQIAGDAARPKMYRYTGE